jgi:hypothetical protein
MSVPTRAGTEHRKLLHTAPKVVFEPRPEPGERTEHERRSRPA